MKHARFGILCTLLALSGPAWAEETAKKETAAKVDEGTKAELDAAKKKFDAAKAELDKVQEKIKANRPEGDNKRPDMSTLAGMAEMFKTALTLTDDQVKKVAALAAAGQKDLDKAMETGKAQGALADAERAKDVVDVVALKKIMLARSEAMVDGDLARVKFTQAVRALLTPDQMKKYAEMKKKMDERSKQRGPGGEGGGHPPKAKGGE